MKALFPIYIINLKRNPERKLFMQRQLDAFGLEYQFIEVDEIDKYALESKAYRNRIAQSLGIDTLVLENKYNAILNHLKTHYQGAKYEKHKNDNLGSLAITLSHIKIYDLMIKNDLSAVCILEDDATLLPTFPEILNAATKLEWDILLLASYSSSSRLTSLVRHKCTKRMRIFDEDLLFINRQIKNLNHSKKQKHRIKCILKEYGFDNRLYPKQSEVVVKAIQEHDIRYAEITQAIAPHHRFSLVKHKQYLTYKALRKHIKDYTSSQLGALPEKSTLNLISDDHCIANPKHLPFLTTAYLLKQSAAIQWKQEALAENPLVIDQIPWKLYRNRQVKLRLITPPCTTTAYHYLIYSARCR